MIDQAQAQLEGVHVPKRCFVRRYCKLGGIINHVVPAGRHDGRVSIRDEVTQSLPPPSFNAQQIVDNFARKGLSAEEMVTLSGAHSNDRCLRLLFLLF